MNTGGNVLKEDTIIVSGMGCASCARTIERNLKSKKGVKNVSVNVDDGKAHVSYDDSLISLSEIEAVIEGSGYTVVRMKE